jgi:cyclopropane fatty-acyl-phospholipid synthase-like methyltransferase
MNLVESEPKIAADAADFWSQSQNSVGLRDLSHWFGEGRWKDEDLWSRVGRLHSLMLDEACAATGLVRPGGRMVEWGPGGGANASVFCKSFQHFHGVDISQANLTECQRQLAVRGLNNFHPVHIDAAQPETCLNHIPRAVDFFMSTAVYQHFPGKDYGLRVTRLAYDMLNPSGLALIQTRYDDGSEQLKPKVGNYHQNALAFTSYRLEEFWAACEQIGFTVFRVTLDPSCHYAYYSLWKGNKNA